MRKHLLEFVIIEAVFLVLGILSASVRTILGETTLTWRSLGTPPGKAIRVVDGDDIAVRVQTVQGQTYFCRLHSKECWIPKDQSSYTPSSRIITSDSAFEFGIYGFRKPPPLHGVVDMQKFFNMHSEYQWVFTIYAVTANENVYVWQDRHDSFSFDPWIYSCQGIFVALLCGFALWWFIQRRATVFQKRMLP